jgi:hypothetical protein
MNLLFVALKFLYPPPSLLSFSQAAHSGEMTLRTFVKLGRPGRRRSRAKMRPCVLAALNAFCTVVRLTPAKAAIASVRGQLSPGDSRGKPLWMVGLEL